jgi:hypothetical protein
MIVLADLKVELDIDASDYSFDAYLAALEPRAVAYVEMRTHRYFGPVASVTEYLRGQGIRELWLLNLPATVPTSVIERAYPGATETTITAANTDGFVVRTDVREAWLVRKGGYLWTRDYEYQVTFTRGYAAGDEPGEIRQLVIDLIASRFAMREAGGAGVQSETIGGYSYRLGDFSDGDLSSLGPMASDTITMWTRPVFA